ncbi:hypothetical protein BV898_14047 [Hypsibius exemplaris]|uniref:Receptor ligand binding region domain-containing protein n=1 Tax=Hypsibius exemplaris TaxID=2072580 RepID=A0A1W0W8T4_HYPEX|nr:hypothetical protein BV898_14047 [Hypsibius exemplaris]
MALGGVEATAVHNVTILIYGIRKLQLLQSLPYTSAGFDVGIREASRRFAGRFNISAVYLPNEEILNCDDTGAQFDLVSRHYYTTTAGNRNINSTLAVFYPEWDVFVLSSDTTFSNLRDRTLYPTTVALGPVQYETYGVFLGKLFAKYNWTSVALIYDVSGLTPFNRLVTLRIQSYFRGHAGGVGVQLHPFAVDVTVGMKYIKYSEILLQVMLLSRIVIISMPHPATRNFLITCGSLGWLQGQLVSQLVVNCEGNNQAETLRSDYSVARTGGPSVRRSTWISIDVAQGPRGPLTWKLNDEYDKVALTQFRSIFKLEVCPRSFTPKFGALLREFRNISERVYNVTFPPHMEPSEYVVTAYNSVLLLAQILNETSNQEDRGPVGGRQITRHFLNRTFREPITGDIYVDAEGERQLPMCLMDFREDGQNFQPTVVYRLGRNWQDALEEIPERTIDWATADGRPPKNQPLHFTDYTVPVAAVLTSLIIVVTLAGTGLTYRHFRREKTKQIYVPNPDWWVLDKDWLIPRGHVDYTVFWKNSVLWKTARTSSERIPSSYVWE